MFVIALVVYFMRRRSAPMADPAPTMTTTEKRRV
jgi:hypothetical protein